MKHNGWKPPRAQGDTSLYATPRGHLRSSLLTLMRRRHHARRPKGRKDGRATLFVALVKLTNSRADVTAEALPGYSTDSTANCDGPETYDSTFTRAPR